MNEIKQKMLRGETVVGTWMQIPSADIAEIIARTGYDFCAVDMEHTEFDESAVADVYRALDAGNCVCAARVAANALMNIRRPLDLGAKILIVPLISNAEEAKKAVKSAKYPPDGVRGYAYCRANNWGADFDEYVKKTNDELVIIAMIETAQAVEKVDEILAVDGIDGVLVGPYDLSGSYGAPGQMDNPQLRAAIGLVVAAAKAHKKTAGQHIVQPTRENIAEAIRQGYGFLALGMDVVALRNGFSEYKAMAKEAEYGDGAHYQRILRKV